MRLSICACVVALATTVACSNDDASGADAQDSGPGPEADAAAIPAADSGGTGGGLPADGGEMDSGSATVAFSVTLYDHGTPPQPLAGVKYAVLDHPEIATAETGTDGRATLAGLPANTEIVLTEEQAGYPPFAYYFTTGNEDVDLGTRVRLPAGFHQLQASQVSVMFDDTRGHVRVSVTQPASGAPVQNATLGMSPASGDGPFYAGPDNVYYPALVATTSSAAPSLFFNVEPGEVEVTIGPDALQCTSELPQAPSWKSGWAPSGPNRVRLGSIAGHLSSVRVFCE